MSFAWSLLSAPDIYDVAIYQRDVIYGLLSAAIDASHVADTIESRCDIVYVSFDYYLWLSFF